MKLIYLFYMDIKKKSIYIWKYGKRKYKIQTFGCQFINIDWQLKSQDAENQEIPN